MPKDKKSKKKKAKQRKVVQPSTTKDPVRITKADNGFVVSQYTDKGERTHIAKSLAQATKAAKTMLGD